MLKITEHPKKMQKAQYGNEVVQFAVIDEPFKIESQLTNVDFQGNITNPDIEGNAGDVLIVAENGTMSIMSAKDFKNFVKIDKKKELKAICEKLHIKCSIKDTVKMLLEKLKDFRAKKENKPTEEEIKKPKKITELLEKGFVPINKRNKKGK